MDTTGHPAPDIAVAPLPLPDAGANLLRVSGLPADDLGSHSTTTVWTASGDGDVQGIAALEQYECYGLLRSVAVAELHRDRGWGRLLTEAALAAARKAELAAVYLLTENAADYFFGLGFVAIGRDAVPPVIRQSREFAELCPETAIAMVRELPI
jgi:amino-acid N-acetyltransferase